MDYNPAKVLPFTGVAVIGGFAVNQVLGFALLLIFIGLLLVAWLQRRSKDTSASGLQ